MKKKFLEEGDPMTYFGTALDPPLGRSRRQTTLVKDYEYFILTKFHQNPSSGSEKKLKMWKFTDDDDAGPTDDGRRAMTIAHLSLRWAKTMSIVNVLGGRAS